jgi:low affinity Fe/Cu permease
MGVHGEDTDASSGHPAEAQRSRDQHNQRGTVGMVHRGSLFDRFSRSVAQFAGHSVAFVAAVALVGVWLVSGPLFGFSNRWQLVINTLTTILTFLMVFVIQNSQNRDGAAIQIKLDELVRAVEGAHNGLLDLEELNENEIQALRKQYLDLAEVARNELRRAPSDTHTTEIQYPS